jgi:hypothetical protein
MDIIITEWALNSYLDLKHNRVFSKIEYENILKPDVMLLKLYPNNPKFQLQQFWSFAESPSGQKIPNAFKMKWDSLGNGNVELRLPVGILSSAILFEAYVKSDDKKDRRMLARFKTHMQLVLQNSYTERGKLK